jgi:two-component system, OmpR family, phosphate regulon sensor histidine kinase PhoR
MTPADAAFAATFADALPGPVIVVGRELRVIAFNQPALAVLPTLAAGAHLVHGLRAPDVLDAVRRVAASGAAEAVSWRERHPVERAFEVHCAALALPGPGAVVLSLTDLTEALRVEQLRSGFIANASHELRTPLASLLGFVETLQGAARDDPRARDNFLKIMRAQGQRMARLIDDLLSLSRIEQKEHVRPADPLDLALIVRHVADTMAHLVTESGAALTISASAEVIVTGDRDELIRVVENLIENALKYGALEERGAAPRVDIEVGAQGRDGFVTVRDHGPGIDALHLPRLTERFYRVDTGVSRAKGGTGLGLAIVKHTLARHRGRLAIASTLGEGAAFTAYVPLHSV